MIAGLYGTRASGVVGLFQRLDVLFIEVAPRVHPIEVNKPPKELEFARQPTIHSGRAAVLRHLRSGEGMRWTPRMDSWMVKRSQAA